ncbi:porin family protein [uncultured Mucilaginibacter sp.]|uniref:porin family protein n=1 Tax=uncultured Mucilaginibacter sp. TaxID=797541 RepID=UPI00263289D7|nr:porin family protein [uncultured Mucilaginibacter sp.]
MLKKYGFVLAVLALLGQQLCAQSVKFGATAGINFPTISAYDNPTHSLDQSKAYSNIKLGFIAEKQWPKLVLQSGLLLDGKGGKDIYINEETNTNRQKDSRLYYLQVPLNLLYRTQTKIGDLYFGGGVYAAYGLWGNYSLSGIIFDSDVDESDKAQFGNDENSDYKRTDYGINLKAEIRLLHGIGFELNYEYGLRNIASPGIYDDANLKTRNKVIGLGVSYLFKHK